MTLARKRFLFLIHFFTIINLKTSCLQNTDLERSTDDALATVPAFNDQLEEDESEEDEEASSDEDKLRCSFEKLATNLDENTSVSMK